MTSSAPGSDDANEAMRRAFGWALHDVFRLFQRSWSRHLRDSGTGISPAQCRVLTSLYARDGLTQTELADEVGMDKAPLGRLLDRVEELGLIIRKPDPMDRRVRRVHLTEAAKALDEPMWEAARGMFDTALENMTPKDMATLLSLLDRLKQNLGGEEDQACFRPGAGAPITPVD
nr:hypothetical protein DBT41_10685 [Aerococcus urinae]